MTVQGASPFVQEVFPDQVGGGFPGVIFSYPDASYNNRTQTFANEGVVICGRAVSKGTLQDFSNSDSLQSKPYTVENVKTGDVAANLVGVITKPTFGVVQSFLDTTATLATPDNKEKAGFGDKNNAPLVEFGSRVIIWVRQDAAIGDILHGDPVYVMLDPANSFGIAVGEFSSEAAGTPAHSLLIPNAIWYQTKTTRDNALDTANTIQLL